MLSIGTGADSTWTIDTTGISALAFYAQHVPTEFERDTHYLFDASRTDIEPAAELGGGGRRGPDGGLGPGAHGGPWGTYLREGGGRTGGGEPTL